MTDMRIPAVLRGLSQKEFRRRQTRPQELLRPLTRDVAVTEGLGNPVKPDHVQPASHQEGFSLAPR